jgi:hypothetical protein
MKRLVLAIFFLITLGTAAAQTCLDNGYGANGTGALSPGIPCLTEFTYPYAGDFTKAHFTVTTQHPGDLLVQLYWEINGASSPMTDRYAYYDSTLNRSHSGVITGLFPGGRGNYLVSFASCGDPVTGQGKYGQNCARTDPNTSIAPWGTAQSNGHQFSTGTPGGSSFTWAIYPGAGTRTFWQGHSGTLAVSNQWLTGSSAPAYLVVTSIKVDGQTCGSAVNNRMSCPNFGYVQYTSDSSEAPSRGQRNIAGSTIISAGNYAGHYFCQGGGACFKGPFNNFVLITPTSSASVCSNNCHTLTMTMQATDTGQNNVGAPQTLTFSFSVLAQPSFTPAPPGSFPPIPAVSNYWAYLAAYGQNPSTCPWCFGILNATETINGELNSPGQYFGGDNFSASLTIGALGQWNYDGARVAYGIGDYLAGSIAGGEAGQWQQGNVTRYTPVFDGTNVQVETASNCSTGGSRPPWSANPGTKTTDGSCVWMNVGNASWWNLYAERIHDQVRDWQLLHDRYTVDSEWNRFTDGDDMHCFRNYSPCNANSLDTRAVEYFLYPFPSPSGGWANQNQRIQWNAFAPETDTLRDREYEIPALYNYWIMSGNPPADNGVNELQMRVDAAIADAQRITEYSPRDGDNFPVAGGLGTASFDIGLNAEALIHYWIVQNYLGQTPDARIPIVVGEMLDWAYSNEWNLAGDHSMPYGLWTVPFGSQLCRQGCTWQQSNLNMLVASAYAWLGAVNGGAGYRLPTSGVSAWTAADEIFQSAFSNVGGGSKEFSQLYKWMPEYLGWRSGTLAGTDSMILPPHNTYLGSTTQNIEPYPQGEYPAAPTAAVSGNSATITWYNTSPMTQLSVKLSLGCTGNYSQVFNCSASGQHRVSGSDNLYVNQCAATNLQGGQYCFGVGGTDAAGQFGFSAVNVLDGRQDWTFYVSCGGLQITTSSLPDGELSQPYSANLQASCGSGSYTWSIVGGALPAGLSLNSSTGAISGTPTTQGTFSFTAKVTDSASNSATANLSITVEAAAGSGLTVTTTGLISGEINAGYLATLSASGGTQPYTWSLVSGSLPAGLALNASSGVINGTPSGSPGTSPFTARVTDAHGQQASANLSITINAAPVITTTSLPNGPVNQPYNASLQRTGGTSPYNWRITSGALPAQLTLVANPTGSASIKGTPTTAGVYNFTVSLTDAYGVQASAALSITISGSISITTASLPPGEVGSPYTGTLQAGGGSGSGYQWCVVEAGGSCDNGSGALPAGLTLAGTGIISGTPTSAGSSTFTVKVTDSQGNSATAQLSITIQPKLVISTTSLPAGVVRDPYTAAIAYSGGLGPYTWSIVSGSLPDGLLLNSGTITGTPTTAGTGSFVVQITDALNNTARASLSITINPMLSITTTQLPGGEINVAYNASVTAGGGLGAYTWSLNSGSLPIGLTLNAATGLIQGNPTTAGTSPFTVKVMDTNGDIATASLNITIQPLPTITTTSLPAGTSGRAYSATLSAAGGVPPYTWSATGLPSGITLSGSTGVLSGTPLRPGTYTVQFTATDANLQIANATITLAIGASPAPPGIH